MAPSSATSATHLGLPGIQSQLAPSISETPCHDSSTLKIECLQATSASSLPHTHTANFETGKPRAHVGANTHVMACSFSNLSTVSNSRETRPTKSKHHNCQHLLNTLAWNTPESPTSSLITWFIWCRSKSCPFLIELTDCFAISRACRAGSSTYDICSILSGTHCTTDG